ncbi:MAG: DUF5671 domain-containing protein [Vicinamibacterales bacterium]
MSPNVSPELNEFVREALRQGVPRTRIAQALADAGWSADQARAALAGFAELAFPVPVPRPRPYTSARDAFLYLVMFTTLYWSAYHLGSLLFAVIDRAFPDPTDVRPGESVLYAVRWSVSALVVSFPVFAAVAWSVERGLRRDPIRRDSKIRRQLTYLTLFVASGVLIGDVSTLVYNLLGGGLTVRFVLKMLVVAAIGGGVFLYYLGDLRAAESEPTP